MRLLPRSGFDTGQANLAAVINRKVRASMIARDVFAPCSSNRQAALQALPLDQKNCDEQCCPSADCPIISSMCRVMLLPLPMVCRTHYTEGNGQCTFCKFRCLLLLQDGKH